MNDIKPYPHVYRISGDRGYGVKAYLNGTQVGEQCAHTNFTRNQPELVQRYLDRMELDLRRTIDGR